MRARVGKEDEYFDKKVVRPPVETTVFLPQIAWQSEFMAKSLLVVSTTAPRCSEAPEKKSQPRGSSSPRPSVVRKVAFQPTQHRSVHLFQSPATSNSGGGLASNRSAS